MSTPCNESSPLACNLMAILSETREGHGATAPQIFALAQEIQELSDGYATRFLNEPGSNMAIAKLSRMSSCAALQLMFHRSLDISLGAQ